jgi:hypothetical protein
MRTLSTASGSLLGAQVAVALRGKVGKRSPSSSPIFHLCSHTLTASSLRRQGYPSQSVLFVTPSDCDRPMPHGHSLREVSRVRWFGSQPFTGQAFRSIPCCTVGRRRAAPLPLESQRRWRTGVGVRLYGWSLDETHGTLSGRS